MWHCVEFCSFDCFVDVVVFIAVSKNFCFGLIAVVFTSSSCTSGRLWCVKVVMRCLFMFLQQKIKSFELQLRNNCQRE